jgi:hypothetical protein
MGNIRSDFVAATLFFSAALVANCQAQTLGNASEGKRVLVLRIVEVGSAQANSVKRSRSARTVKKKKVAGRNPVGRALPIEPDAAKQIENPGSSIPIAESPAPEKNIMEQTGILTFNDRAVAFASFSNEGGNIGSLTKDILPATESQGVHGPVIDNSTDIADQEPSQSGARANQEASQSGARSPSIFPVLAIFSGAILAGFGLVSSRGGRETRELGPGLLNA